MFILKCPICKNNFQHPWSGRIFCSRKCMSKDPKRKLRMKKLGESNIWSKGKRLKGRPNFHINPRGYKLLYKPDHPTSDKKGYIMEHRFIMEQHLNRFLEPQEKVHHINKNRLDNRIENLELIENQGKHTEKHKDKITGRFI